MKTKNKIVVIVLTIICLLNFFQVIINSRHNCVGEDCHFCLVKEECKKNNEVLKLTVPLIFSIIISILAIKNDSKNSFVKLNYFHKSLVKLKIKLSE